MSNTDTAPTETYAEKAGRIAAELLDVLRDALGPGSRLPGPLADYFRYGDHSVTVRDGEDGRVEVTAHLTATGLIKEYSARITRGDREPAPRTAVGPLRVDCSEAPEEHPTLTYVLLLVIRLESAKDRLERARRALEAAGYWSEVEVRGSRIVLPEPRPWGSQAVATVELDLDNGSLRVSGRDAGLVQEILYRAKVF